MIEDVFRSKAPEWKLKNAMYSDDTRIYSEWQSEQGKVVVVQIIKMASSGAAAANFNIFDRKMARGAVTESTQPSQPIQADTVLPDLGDENIVWTEFGEARGTLIKFRIENAIVQVDSADTDSSVTLAHLLADRLTPKTE